MKVTCLIDNCVEQGSPFWGEHGLAILIESGDGALLLDTGASGDVLMHNLKAARVEAAKVDAIALSHAHHDHTGGLEAFLAVRGALPIYYAHGDLFIDRLSRPRRAAEAKEPADKRPETLHSIGLLMKPEVLRRAAELRLCSFPRQVMPGIWLTGPITERAEPEGGSPRLLMREEGRVVRDAYRDDMSVVLQGRRGLTLVCGCSHSGLLNIVAHVKKVFDAAPRTIIGGTHLKEADAAHLARVVEVLGGRSGPTLYVNHCTGMKAFAYLSAALGDKVRPCPAGTVIRV